MDRFPTKYRSKSEHSTYEIMHEIITKPRVQMFSFTI